MKDLDTLRVEIDAIDKDITRLFEQRMNVAKEIGEYKKAHDLPVLNSSREQVVIEKNIARLENEDLGPYLNDFYTQLMRVSREYQSSLIGTRKKIAYTGVAGSFAYEATQKYINSKAYPFVTMPEDVLCYDTFDKLCMGLLNNDADFIVIPFENSTTGAVVDVYDLLVKYDFYICGEVCVKVNHNLLAKEGTKIEDIKEVYSHSQAFMQSRDYLKDKPFKQIPYYNTAISAKYVSESDRNDIAAVASVAAAELYGLKVLDYNINFNQNNITKFIVLSKKKVVSRDADKLSAIMTIDDRPGQLHSILNIFNEKGVNLSKIESRPDVNNPFEYIFFIDFEGNENDEKIRTVIDFLNKNTKNCKFLGNYVSDKLR